jgi:hypothetical protein
MKIKYKTLGNIDVYPNDIGDTTWHQAIEACEALGYGWRLPTKEELNQLYKQQTTIGGFMRDVYWSFLEDDANSAWCQNFYDGYQSNVNKLYTGYVRPVRTTASQLMGTPWA